LPSQLLSGSKQRIDSDPDSENNNTSAQSITGSSLTTNRNFEIYLLPENNILRLVQEFSRFQEKVRFSHMKKGFGLDRLLHNFRYRRDKYRQFIGVMFIVLMSVVGKPSWGVFVTGTVVVLLGILVRMWASGHIKKNKELATDGPYAYVRHPLYVGNTLLGIGFSAASGLWWGFPLFFLVMLAFYPQAIRREDQKLHRLFGGQWEKWRRNTRALIPNISAKGAFGGQWSFYQSLRQNGEPIIALFLIACLYFLYIKL
jgi:hypothetical protein